MPHKLAKQMRWQRATFALPCFCCCRCCFSWLLLLLLSHTLSPLLVLSLATFMGFPVPAKKSWSVVDIRHGQARPALPVGQVISALICPARAIWAKSGRTWRKHKYPNKRSWQAGGRLHTHTHTLPTTHFQTAVDLLPTLSLALAFKLCSAERHWQRHAQRLSSG